MRDMRGLALAVSLLTVKASAVADKFLKTISPDDLFVYKDEFNGIVTVAGSDVSLTQMLYYEGFSLVVKAVTVRLPSAEEFPIRLRAEDVSRRHIEIHAMNLIVPEEGALIDVSGVEGKSSLVPASMTDTPGGNGTDGEDGGDGTIGGSIRISVASIVGGKLTLLADGGSGGLGQAGSDGALGQNGGIGSLTEKWSTACCKKNPDLKGSTGGTGGYGGRGGNGGRGGQAGSVQVDYAGVEGTKDPVVVVSAEPGQAGLGGAPGSGADGGHGGPGHPASCVKVGWFRKRCFLPLGERGDDGSAGGDGEAGLMGTSPVETGSTQITGGMSWEDLRKNHCGDHLRYEMYYADKMFSQNQNFVADTVYAWVEAVRSKTDPFCGSEHSSLWYSHTLRATQRRSLLAQGLDFWGHQNGVVPALSFEALAEGAQVAISMAEGTETAYDNFFSTFVQDRMKKTEIENSIKTAEMAIIQAEQKMKSLTPGILEMRAQVSAQNEMWIDYKTNLTKVFSVCDQKIYERGVKKKYGWKANIDSMVTFFTRVKTITTSTLAWAVQKRNFLMNAHLLAKTLFDEKLALARNTLDSTVDDVRNLPQAVEDWGNDKYDEYTGMYTQRRNDGEAFVYNEIDEQKGAAATEWNRLIALKNQLLSNKIQGNMFEILPNLNAIVRNDVNSVVGQWEHGGQLYDSYKNLIQTQVTVAKEWAVKAKDLATNDPLGNAMQAGEEEANYYYNKYKDMGKDYVDKGKDWVDQQRDWVDQQRENVMKQIWSLKSAAFSWVADNGHWNPGPRIQMYSGSVDSAIEMWTGKIPECAAYVEEFKTVMKMKDEYQDLISQHDELVNEYAQVQSERESSLLNRNSLLRNSDYDPRGSTEITLMTDAYKNRKSNVVRILKQMRSRLNYEFCENEPFDYEDGRISQLQAFYADLWSERLRRVAARNQRLEMARWSSEGRMSAGITMRIDRESHPNAMMVFWESGELVFDISREELPKGVSNIRVSEAQVYVPALVGNQDIGGAVAQVWIKRTGRSTCTSASGGAHTFAHKPEIYFSMYSVLENTVEDGMSPVWYTKQQKSDVMVGPAPSGEWRITIPGLNLEERLHILEFQLYLTLTFSPCDTSTCQEEVSQDANSDLKASSRTKPTFIGVANTTLCSMVAISLMIAVLGFAYARRRVSLNDSIEAPFDTEEQVSRVVRTRNSMRAQPTSVHSVCQ